MVFSFSTYRVCQDRRCAADKVLRQIEEVRLMSAGFKTEAARQASCSHGSGNTRPEIHAAANTRQNRVDKRH